jgi:toxin ParE1/3/4
MSNSFDIIWTETACEDLDWIIEYIASREGVKKALSIYESFLEKIKTLEAHPARCRIVPQLKEMGLSEFRELIFRPYVVFFHIKKRKVILLGVLDSRRDLAALLMERALGKG